MGVLRAVMWLRRQTLRSLDPIGDWLFGWCLREKEWMEKMVEDLRSMEKFKPDESTRDETP